MIKLAIFDMDGTLLDTEKSMYGINLRKAAQMLGKEMPVSFHQKLIGRRRDECDELFRELFGADFDLDKYFKVFDVLNRETIENGKVPLMKGVKELLDYFKEKGVIMCVATSTMHDYATNLLNKCHILDYFDYVFGGDEVKKGKPDPEVLLKALDYYGFSKDEALVFEDGHFGAQAAIASGIRLVLVPDLAELSQDDFDQAYKVLDNIADIIPYIED